MAAHRDSGPTHAGLARYLRRACATKQSTEGWFFPSSKTKWRPDKPRVSVSGPMVERHAPLGLQTYLKPRNTSYALPSEPKPDRKHISHGSQPKAGKGASDINVRHGAGIAEARLSSNASENPHANVNYSRCRAPSEAPAMSLPRCLLPRLPHREHPERYIDMHVCILCIIYIYTHDIYIYIYIYNTSGAEVLRSPPLLGNFHPKSHTSS